MKSLKSVLVVAFACAMLFAFTACEQAPINMPSSDADKAVAKVTFVSSDTTFYEGVSYGQVPVVVDVEYKDGTTTTGVTAIMTANNVKAGANAFPAVLNANSGNTENYLVEVNGIAIAGLEVVAGDTFTDEVLTITADEYSDWDPSAWIATAPESVKVLYADDTTSDNVVRDLTTGYSLSYDSSNKANVSGLIVTYGSWTEILPVSVEIPEDIPALTKGEVDAFKVIWTITGVTEADNRTVEGTSVTVRVGEKASYALYGTSSSQLADQDDYEMVEGDYDLSHDTLSAVLTSTSAAGFTATNITSDDQPAYTATVTFVSDSDDPNYAAGSVDPVTLTLTVEDNITNLSSISWIYDANADGTADTLDPNTAVTINPNSIRATVQTAGGSPVVLVADVIKDKAYYSVADLTTQAGSSISLSFKWKVADGSYPNTGEGTVSIGVNSI